MKKFLCITMLVFLFLLTGCDTATPDAPDEPPQPESGAVSIAFLSSMGCSDRNCADVSHYHACPADCANYDHYHSCALGCSETQHHHSSQSAAGGHEERHESEHHEDTHH